MFRRLVRFVLASAALGGAGFAVFKLVQSRRGTGASMPSGDDSIMPTRSETPLVKPSLMDGLDLRKAGDGPGDEHRAGNGQRATEAAPVEVATPPVEVATPPVEVATPPVEVATPAVAVETPPTAAEAPGGSGWVEPDAGGACPDGYPVKAKLASGIFHVPGMLAYDRTTPDRCYRDEASAEADGLRKAKR